MNAERRERIERLKVDVDTRLADVWVLFWGSTLDTDDDDAGQVFGSAIRAAYAKGYMDALREEREGKRGELARANGYTEGGA